jgi:hypothetical protein
MLRYLGPQRIGGEEIKIGLDDSLVSNEVVLFLHEVSICRKGSKFRTVYSMWRTILVKISAISYNCHAKNDSEGLALRHGVIVGCTWWGTYSGGASGIRPVSTTEIKYMVAVLVSERSVNTSVRNTLS